MSFVNKLTIVENGGEDGTFRPQLTSLIDVMTILLVFLIKSFSVEGNIVTPSNDLELPLSISQKPPKPAASIEITTNSVMSGGKTIVSVESFVNSDSLLIPKLMEWMVFERNKSTDTLNTGEVLIQSDKELEFNVVKRVMYTCSRAGFSNFSILVQEDE